MKIGYPCINWTIGCKGDRTFRLKSYSEERLKATVENNINCLFRMLEYNVRNHILFFRITSDLVPFASHPVCTFGWQNHFEGQLREIGDFIKGNHIRISMHPDQFVVINSLDRGVFERSLRELFYHVQVLDLMKLDSSAKIQIHGGGIYKNKEKSMDRFISRFIKLDETMRGRLVLENDDKLYNFEDCLRINHETGVPIVFDFLHYEANNSGETLTQAFKLLTDTWRGEDGLPMVDYSKQRKDAKKGRHAETIDLQHFRAFLEETKPFDYDIMLEIKDKEKSAHKAVRLASKDRRFFKSSTNHPVSTRLNDLLSILSDSHLTHFLS